MRTSGPESAATSAAATGVGAWLITTPKGYILFDTLDNAKEAKENIVDEMVKNHLDPKQIKYIIFGHWHGDHTGGAHYMQQLTGAPEPMIRRLIAACGLAWHDACLRPESNPRAVRTPSKWQARQPIYRNSVARWRRYEPWLGPLRALVDDGSELETGIAKSRLG